MIAVGLGSRPCRGRVHDGSVMPVAASQAALAANTQGKAEAMRASAAKAGGSLRRCGTRDPTPAQQRKAEGVIAQTKGEGHRISGLIQVGIHFTIFTTVGTPTAGTSNVPDAIIVRQVADMNTFYNRYVRPLHPPPSAHAPSQRFCPHSGQLQARHLGDAL